MSVEIRRCEEKDMDELNEFACKAFCDSFGAFNTKENMDIYLRTELGKDELLSEYLCPNVSFFLLTIGPKLGGYIKLNEAPSQTDINDTKSLELERIYISADLKGRGFGGLLIEKTVSEGLARGKSYIWLGVWEKNENAIGFYKKYGFYVTGTHSFILGEDVQTDLIMRKDL